MQALPKALARLERLHALIEEYVPIMHQSTDRKQELARQIPEAYGAVEDVYRQYVGDQKASVRNGTHISTFRSYFEAGFLSGSSLHSHQGARELEKVIGRIRADIEDGAGEQSAADPLESAWTLLHPRVQVVAQPRFRSGHYADAVEATLKELASTVRALVLQRGGPELDGTALMQMAFSPKSPIIVLADLTTQSGKDMQRGYMDMFAGAMSAIRNPKAHGNVLITRERSLHFLFVASTLWYTLDERP
jgi:uncharacterized protein (TIGR02391 family)